MDPRQGKVCARPRCRKLMDEAGDSTRMLDGPVPANAARLGKNEFRWWCNSCQKRSEKERETSRRWNAGNAIETREISIFKELDHSSRERQKRDNRAARDVYRQDFRRTPPGESPSPPRRPDNVRLDFALSERLQTAIDKREKTLERKRKNTFETRKRRRDKRDAPESEIGGAIRRTKGTDYLDDDELDDEQIVPESESESSSESNSESRIVAATSAAESQDTITRQSRYMGQFYSPYREPEEQARTLLRGYAYSAAPRSDVSFATSSQSTVYGQPPYSTAPRSDASYAASVSFSANYSQASTTHGQSTTGHDVESDFAASTHISDGLQAQYATYLTTDGQRLPNLFIDSHYEMQYNENRDKYKYVEENSLGYPIYQLKAKYIAGKH